MKEVAVRRAMKRAMKRPRPKKGRDPSNTRIKEVLAELDEMDLPDGAYWQMAHDKLGLSYGELFQIIGSDPECFGNG